MSDNKTYAVFKTNNGDFTVELFQKKHRLPLKIL